MIGCFRQIRVLQRQDIGPLNYITYFNPHVSEAYQHWLMKNELNVRCFNRFWWNDLRNVLYEKQRKFIVQRLMQFKTISMTFPLYCSITMDPTNSGIISKKPFGISIAVSMLFQHPKAIIQSNKFMRKKIIFVYSFQLIFSMSMFFSFSFDYWNQSHSFWFQICWNFFFFNSLSLHSNRSFYLKSIEFKM